jgi:hypothetical protein
MFMTSTEIGAKNMWYDESHNLTERQEPVKKVGVDLNET